jgi:AmmeMemoRadiSam system protein A
MFNDDQRAALLTLARDSIRYGLEQGRPIAVDEACHDSFLRQDGACFVTLHLHKRLRGCIGSLQAYRSLLKDVSENAYAAAFRDPRFSPLTVPEFTDIELDISVLTSPVAMSFTSEQDLLRQLRPGEDGLILSAGSRRGTFLPSVWEQLPTPREFLQHLKLKAGLVVDEWPADIHVSRYSTEIFGDKKP